MDGAATIQSPLYHPRDTSSPLTLTHGKLCRWRDPWSVSFWIIRGGEVGEKQGRKDLVLPPLFRASRGRRRPTWPSKRHCFTPFFLMNSVWKGDKYVRVHIGPQFVICSIASSITILIVKINSITSLPNSIAGLEVGRLFQIDHWSWISAIWPSIEQ
jgi:hypothetical protein